MIFNNLLRILKDYRFSVIKIFLYEFVYIFFGFKGNKFNFSSNKFMADDIPTPYFFLRKIKIYLNLLNFNTFIDFGCGSGRVIYYLSKSFPNKKFIGMEYFLKQFTYTFKLFENNENVSIYKKNFTKINISKYKADCFFFNNPFQNDSDFLRFINYLIKINKTNKKTIFIFFNFFKKIFSKLTNLKKINSYYISPKKGFYFYKIK